MNANRANEKGTHWWSFLHLQPKKQMVLQDNKEILYKILFGIE